MTSDHQDDPYLALGLTGKPEDISENEIKKAYRKLALKYALSHSLTHCDHSLTFDMVG